jgi:phosphoheptose isomerase
MIMALIYSRQLEDLACESDLFTALTTSGNIKSILNTVQKSVGLKFLG